jgi:serine phosphatase RsbU (regulator of sigma subunit)
MISQVEPFEPDETAPDSWTVNGIRVTTRVMPVAGATRGGDWCDAFAVDDDLTAFSVGDVSGHGDHKYAAMTAIRRVIREAVLGGLDPVTTIEAANAFVQRYDPNEIATAIVGLLSRRLRLLSFANAGHPAPLMAGSGGASYLAYPSADLPLGVESPYVPELHGVAVPAATLLVFYTDGITEHERTPLQGEAQLADAAAFAYELPTLQAAAVIEKRMQLCRPLRDDAAIMAAWSSP